MTDAEILTQYDKEMRAHPPPEPGIRIERSGNVVRAVGRYNCILLSELGEADANAAIDEQKRHFIAASTEVEWKVYGHDLPADLGQRLAEAGFVADEAETLMAFDLTRDVAAGPLPPDIVVERIDDPVGLSNFIAVNEATWPRKLAAMYESYASRLRDATLGLYVAYDGRTPVAAGRLELPRDRVFAGLWGGCTVPGHRGRGIFRAVVAARANEARERGYRFLNVDAAGTSRAILERLGFIALTGVTGWRMKVATK